jgi:hypothetical protein
MPVKLKQKRVQVLDSSSEDDAAQDDVSQSHDSGANGALGVRKSDAGAEPAC